MEPDYFEQARQIRATARMVQMRTFSRQIARCAGGDRKRLLELTVPQVNTLLTIRDRGQVTIKELAEALQVSAPAASAMVDRLVEMGAVTREQNPEDRREVAVRVAPLGEQSVNAVENQILEALSEILRKLGPKRAQDLCDIYGGIRQILLDEVLSND